MFVWVYIRINEYRSGCLSFFFFSSELNVYDNVLIRIQYTSSDYFFFFSFSLEELNVSKMYLSIVCVYVCVFGSLSLYEKLGSV